MERDDKIIILCHDNITGPINLMPSLQIFATFFILVIILLLVINLQELNKIQQITNSLSEEIKSGVLYSDLSNNFPIYRYFIISRVEPDTRLKRLTATASLPL